MGQTHMLRRLSPARVRFDRLEISRRRRDQPRHRPGWELLSVPGEYSSRVLASVDSLIHSQQILRPAPMPGSLAPSVTGHKLEHSENHSGADYLNRFTNGLAPYR